MEQVFADEYQLITDGSKDVAGMCIKGTLWVVESNDQPDPDTTPDLKIAGPDYNISDPLGQPFIFYAGHIVWGKAGNDYLGHMVPMGLASGLLTPMVTIISTNDS